MANTNPTVPDQVNIITLKCARDWHKAFKDQNNKTGFAKREFPSSIAIPFADIEQIVNDFNKLAGVGVNGVRLYFIIKPGAKSKGRPETRISGILVPTQGPIPNPEGIFNDLIVNANLKAGAPKNPDCPGGNNVSASSARIASVSDEDYVSVYDFVRPCPPWCDPESLMNSEEYLPV